ncbi:MAG: VOC family protein [Coleofasciculaceae cyanobacterium]
MTFQYSQAFVTLAAINAETLIRFYSQLLQQKPLPHIPKVYAEFQLSGLRLAIFQPQVQHQREFRNSAQSGMSLCLEVENLEEAIAWLTNLGNPPPGAITIASHGREIYGYDPAGNRLILHQSKLETISPQQQT